MTFFGPDLRNGLPIGLGSVAGFGTARQFSPLSLFAGGVQGAWYDPSDSTTLFSDRAGTTPCAAPGAGALVPVGAMLDERAPGYSVYFDGTGDFLSCASSAVFGLGTGDFTIEFWVYSTSLSGGRNLIDFRSTSPQVAITVYTSGTSLRLNVNNSDVIDIASAFNVNVWYHVALVKNNNSTQFYINGIASGSAYNDTNNYVSPSPLRVGTYWGQDAVFFAGYISNLRIVKGTAVYTGNFTPPTSPLSPISGTSLLTCGTSWSGNPAITKNGDARVDGLNPFQASPVGNHAIAANDTTARPELSARVNLLLRSEEFNDAAWDKLNGVTVTQNVAVAPDGTTTADKLIAPNSTGTVRVIRQALTSGINGVSYVSSFYAKYVSGEFAWIRALGTDAGVVWFDIQNGVRGTVTGANTTGTITSVGNGWYRCVITSTASSVNIYSYLNPVDADGGTTTTGDGSKGVLIWGADLRPANIGTTIPAYQRVADQYTYDSTGFPRYLAFNGTSSAMSTPANVNLSGTDKATVFAGVRKNAAGISQLVEFSVDASSTNGSFSMPSDTGTGTWATSSRSTSALRTAQSATNSYVAPISTANTGLHDLSLSTDGARLRVNGTQAAVSGAGAGGGNFGTYPLFIGSRNLGSLFLSGNIYSLIVVGSAVSAGNISSTETWVNNKVGGAY